MSHDEARVRADFDLWWTKGIDSRGPVGIGVHNEARDAYLAAARHYSAEADALRADIRSFQDGYHQIAEALGTTVPATSDEDLVDRVERMRAELERVRAERDETRAKLSPERARQWLEEFLNRCPGIDPHDDEAHIVDALLPYCWAIKAAAERPRPDDAEALRQRVVEAAMAWAAEAGAPGIVNRLEMDRLGRRLRASVAELESASSPAPDPVEAAAGRLRAVLDRSSGRIWLDGDYHADLRAVLDALGAKGAKA